MRTKKFSLDSTSTERADSMTTEELQYKFTSTSKSVEKDIGSTPFSGSEDIFEILKWSVHIQHVKSTETYLHTEKYSLNIDECLKS